MQNERTDVASAVVGEVHHKAVQSKTAAGLHALHQRVHVRRHVIRLERALRCSKEGGSKRRRVRCDQTADNEKLGTYQIHDQRLVVGVLPKGHVLILSDQLKPAYEHGMQNAMNDRCGAVQCSAGRDAYCLPRAADAARTRARARTTPIHHKVVRLQAAHSRVEDGKAVRTSLPCSASA